MSVLQQVSRGVVSYSSAARTALISSFFASITVMRPLLSCPGNGYCRSEAAVAVLLTKKAVAKRVYATVVNAGNNTDGYKEQGEDASGVRGNMNSLQEFMYLDTKIKASW